jgi:hypothetical protein
LGQLDVVLPTSCFALCKVHVWHADEAGVLSDNADRFPEDERNRSRPLGELRHWRGIDRMITAMRTPQVVCESFHRLERMEANETRRRNA